QDNDYNITLSKRELRDIGLDIVKICNKMFNIKLKFRFIETDDKMEIDSGAYTILSHKNTSDLTRQLNKIVVEKDVGTYYLKTTDINVSMELPLFRNARLSNDKNILPVKFTGRHITSILLHELGHNIYLPIFLSWISKDSSDRYMEFRHMNQKIASYNITEDMTNWESEKRNKFLLFIVSVIVGGMLMPYSMLLGAVFPIVYGKKLVDTSRREVHGMSERVANNLPSLYGYGTEIIQFYTLISKAHGGTTYFKKKGILSKIGRMFLDLFGKKSSSDQFHDSSENIIRTLEFEVKNKNNDPEIRKELETSINQAKKANELLIRMSN